jgi:hypothetical protein
MCILHTQLIGTAATQDGLGQIWLQRKAHMRTNEMGDRGNIIVKDGDSTVFLYTHWSGSDLPETVKSALQRGKDRWTDGPYLARILFCEMVKGDEMSLTGFGISSTMCDGGTDITINVDEQTVREDTDAPPVSFAEYVSRQSSEAA